MSSRDKQGIRIRKRTTGPSGAAVSTGTALSDAFDDWRGAGERWLFISPHDDDVIVGSGLLIQRAVEEGVDISVVITTDGRMGYCDLAQREAIVEIRKRETLESFALVGVDKVSWLGFPDGDLARNLGRRRAQEGDPGVIEGYAGLQNAYVRILRDLRPTRLFVATGNDLHPDHKYVYQEALVSIFHAQGEIWPELGLPIPEAPAVYEMAVYSPFPEDPNIMIEGRPVHLERKLAAISAYRSQKQIDLIVQNQRMSGAVEYLRQVAFSLYTPAFYSGLFG